MFYRNRTRFLRKRTVTSSITIWSLATIWTTAMYISFFLFEVQVASGDCRVVIFARIRVDNLPVHLGCNSNGSRVNLQLLKSYKDVNGHEFGCLPFVRINRLARALNNGKGFFQKQQTNRGKWRLPFALRFTIIVFG